MGKNLLTKRLKRRKRTGRYKGMAKDQADKYKLLREAGVPSGEASIMKNWSWAKIEEILNEVKHNEEEIF